jgi:radical SAM superfamily enzyme YgiQ (UPF0313 family)
VGDVADVGIIDLRGRQLQITEAAKLIIEAGGDYIGICLNSAPHAAYTKVLVKRIKKFQPDARIIVGGQMATFIDEELLRTGAVDAVVRGEGELTLREILERGTFDGVLGTSVLRKGEVLRTPDRPLIADLDTLPVPDKTLIADRSPYKIGRARVEGIETSRGCPHRCTFCSIRRFHRGKWRAKSPDRVIEEVKLNLPLFPDKKHAIVYFADDNQVASPRRMRELLKKLIRLGEPIFYWCQARVDVLDRNPDLVTLMAKANFVSVLLGVETPNQDLLDKAHKGTTIAQAERVVRNLRRHDIAVWGTFTVGFPGESRKDMHRTIDFISRLDIDIIQLTVVTPIPGSEMYDDLVAAGEIRDPDWEDYNFCAPTMRGQLSRGEMAQLLNEGYFRAYCRPGYILSAFADKARNVNRTRAAMLKVFWHGIRYAAASSLRTKLGLGTVTEADYLASTGWSGPTDVEE